MDSTFALDLLKMEVLYLTHLNHYLVDAITDVLAKEWHVKLSHVQKDNNQVVDRLACMGLKLKQSFGVSIFPPFECLACYLEDLGSVSS